MRNETDDIRQEYLQRAHDLGGGIEMALNMMAQRIQRLEDRLAEATRDVPTLRSNINAKQ